MNLTLRDTLRADRNYLSDGRLAVGHSSSINKVFEDFVLGLLVFEVLVLSFLDTCNVSVKCKLTDPKVTPETQKKIVVSCPLRKIASWELYYV